MQPVGTRDVDVGRRRHELGHGAGWTTPLRTWNPAKLLVGLALTAAILAIGPAGVCLLSPTAAAVGVRPLLIDITAQPGEEKEFELVLSPGATDSGKERVHLGLYRTAQLPTGELTYQPADPTQEPAVGWVSLGPAEVQVEPGRELQLRGLVKVPFDARRGTHTIAIMVEPERAAAAGQIVIRMVYAVRLTINVDGGLLRPRLEADPPTLQADDERHPYAQIGVHNVTGLKFPVTGQMTVRDAARRLVERVDLSTPAAHQAGLDHTPIYPNAQLVLGGSIRSPLPPGTYELRAFLQYGDGLQLIRTAQVTVGEGQFAVAASPGSISAGVKIDPPQLEVSLRPGGMDVQVINLMNRGTQPVLLAARWREIDPSYERSLLRQLNVAIRGSREVELQPGRPGRFIVSVQAPRDLAPGGYYAWLDIAEISGGKVLRVHSQLVAAVVAGEWTPRAQILDLSSVPEEDGELISVSVRNDTPVAIRPTGTVTLTLVPPPTPDGEATPIEYKKGPWDLSLPPDSQDILPGRTALLFAKVPGLLPGAYPAHIQITWQGKVLATVEKDLVVEAGGAPAGQAAGAAQPSGVGQADGAAYASGVAQAAQAGWGSGGR